MGNRMLKSRRSTSYAKAGMASNPPLSEVHQFSRTQLQLMRTWLPDLLSMRPATQLELGIIEEHWHQLNLFDKDADNNLSFTTKPEHSSKCNELAPVVDFFDRFYHQLFELAPATKAVFHCSVHFKGHALMRLLQGITTLLHEANPVQKAAEVAKRHVSYGVKREFFNPLGVALLKSLETVSPTLWCKPVADSWRIVYCNVALLVLTQMDCEMKHNPTMVTKGLEPIEDSNENTDDFVTTWRRHSYSTPSGAKASPTARRYSMPRSTVASGSHLDVKETADPTTATTSEDTTVQDISDNELECPYSGKKLSEMPQYVPQEQRLVPKSCSAVGSGSGSGPTPTELASALPTKRLSMKRRNSVAPVEPPSAFLS